MRRYDCQAYSVCYKQSVWFYGINTSQPSYCYTKKHCFHKRVMFFTIYDFYYSLIVIRPYKHSTKLCSLRKLLWCGEGNTARNVTPPLSPPPPPPDSVHKNGWFTHQIKYEHSNSSALAFSPPYPLLSALWTLMKMSMTVDDPSTVHVCLYRPWTTCRSMQ